VLINRILNNSSNSFYRSMFKKIQSTILLFIIAFSAVAQDEIEFKYANPQEYVIGGIRIGGVRFLDHNILISLTGLVVGDTIFMPGDKVTNAIEKLWKQGLFSDIEIYADRVEVSPDLHGVDKVFLTINMQERPRLASFEFAGSKKSELEDLKEKVALIRGQQVTDEVKSRIIKRTKDFYIEKGFLHAEAKVVEREDSIFQNSVNLLIMVNRNERIKINEIIVDGNNIISDKKIRRYMKKTKQKGLWSFKPSKYIVNQYEEDKKKIIEKYNALGYRDVSITRDSLYDVASNRVNLVVYIAEGKQYFIRNITWIGNTKYTAEQLSLTLKIKRGDVFDQAVLDRRLVSDPDAVGNLYMDDGYLFYRCTPVEVKIENDSIDIEMRIIEGKQAVINSVIITGNTKTKDHVVRREIKSIPGELFSKTNITRTIRELAQLGHFDPEKLNVNPMPNPVDGTVDLEYIVEEKPNDQIEISGGWGANMIVGTLGVRFNNFSTRDFFHKGAWKPVPSGDGQQLSIQMRASGKYYQSYSISFVEPWLGGKRPTSFTTSIYHTVQSNGRVGDDRQSMQINGASVGIGRRLSWPDDYFSLYNEISFQNYRLDSWNYFLIKDGNSNTMSLKTVFSRNSVDNPLYARSGASFSLSLQITPPFSLLDDIDSYKGLSGEEKYKWVEYHKWKFKADWYTRLIGDLVLRSNTEFGFLGNYNEDLQSPFEGFILGGDGMTGYNYYGSETIALRGYENQSLTPRIDGNMAGNLYTKYTMELRYPVSLNPSATVYALLFLEAGKSWNKFRDFNPFNVNRSAGVGVRIFLPMLGLMGVDWGYGFDEIPGQKSDAWGPHFHFVLGQQF